MRYIYIYICTFNTLLHPTYKEAREATRRREDEDEFGWNSRPLPTPPGHPHCHPFSAPPELIGCCMRSRVRSEEPWITLCLLSSEFRLQKARPSTCGGQAR